MTARTVTTCPRLSARRTAECARAAGGSRSHLGATPGRCTAAPLNLLRRPGPGRPGRPPCRCAGAPHRPPLSPRESPPQPHQNDASLRRPRRSAGRNAAHRRQGCGHAHPACGVTPKYSARPPNPRMSFLSCRRTRAPPDRYGHWGSGTSATFPRKCLVEFHKPSPETLSRREPHVCQQAASGWRSLRRFRRKRSTQLRQASPLKCPVLPLSDLCPSCRADHAPAVRGYAPQPLHGLAGDCGDYLEVLIQMQDVASPASSAVAAMIRSAMDSARCWPLLANRAVSISHRPVLGRGSLGSHRHR